MNEIDFKKAIEKFSLEFTPEYLEQLSKNSYKNDREYPENFSNWHKNIKNFRKL